MSQTVEKQMSLREFAKHVGLTDGAVRQAIIAGNIVNGVIKTKTGTPRIIPSLAMLEWGKEPAEGQEKPDDIKIPEAKLKDYKTGIPDNISKAEADRLKALYSAKKARLEFEEIQGNLINKGLVYAKLFDFAQTVRNTVMNVPDRCIDNVLAAPGRNEAIIVMGDELAAALESLANTNDFEIIEKR